VQHSADDREDLVETEELIRKHETDLSTLSPDVRAMIEAAEAQEKEMRAAGQFAPPRDPRDNYAIGLDDNFDPFPLRADQPTDANGAEDEGHD
jgi:hypothetical protein